MSVSSVANLPLSLNTAPAPAKAPAASTHTDKLTHFADILQRGKAAARDDHSHTAPSPKNDREAEDDTSKAEAADKDSDDAAKAKPEDIDAAADEGVSAVLALLSGMQASPPATPVTPKTDGTDSIADVAAAAAKSAATAATDASAAATPAPRANVTALSPAGQQLLQDMLSGKKPAVAQATTDAPDISAMAAALNRAFAKPAVAATPANAAAQANAAQASPAIAVAAAAAADQTTSDDGPAPKRGSGDGDALAALTGTPLPTDPGATPIMASGAKDGAAVPLDATTNAPNGVLPTHGELSVTRHLDMLRDTQWLDRLAQDITSAATQTGHLKFQLNPEHLGSLAVEITNSAAGASIRMTTDNDHARTIIADAQPRLLAEVRAQGLRVAESHVDMGNQANSGSSAGQQRSSEDHKPFLRTQVAMSEEASDSPPRDDGLYA